MIRVAQRGVGGLRTAVVVALLVASAATAQEPPPAADAQPPRDAAAPANRIALEGRIELQAERDEKEGRVPEQTLGLDTARLELTYERGRWLGATLEVEGAQGKAELLDAFVRVGPRALRTRVGRFKPPISAVEMESSWTLPLLRRGILHQVLEDRMRFVGRRPGVQLEASAKGKLRPALRVGAFQGLAPGGALLPTVGILETGIAGRASARPGPVELGAFGALVGTEPVAGFGLGRYWISGLDAVLDVAAMGFGFRAWVDACYGKSFYALGLVGFDGMFAAGRAIAAVRWGGQEAGRAYVEAFGLAETVRFDLDTPGSTLTGAVVGLNVGLWDRLRFGIQVQERRSGATSPPFTDGGNQLRDRRAYLIELGGSLGHAWRS